MIEIRIGSSDGLGIFLTYRDQSFLAAFDASSWIPGLPVYLRIAWPTVPREPSRLLGVRFIEPGDFPVLTSKACEGPSCGSINNGECVWLVGLSSGPWWLQLFGQSTTPNTCATDARTVRSWEMARINNACAREEFPPRKAPAGKRARRWRFDVTSDLLF